MMTRTRHNDDANTTFTFGAVLGLVGPCALLGLVEPIALWSLVEPCGASKGGGGFGVEPWGAFNSLVGNGSCTDPTLIGEGDP